MDIKSFDDQHKDINERLPLFEENQIVIAIMNFQI